PDALTAPNIESVQTVCCKPLSRLVRSFFSQGYAPGRAVRLQPGKRGFDSFYPCCLRHGLEWLQRGLMSPSGRFDSCFRDCRCIGVAALHTALSRLRYGFDTRIHRLLPRGAALAALDFR